MKLWISTQRTPVSVVKSRFLQRKHVSQVFVSFRTFSDAEHSQVSSQRFLNLERSIFLVHPHLHLLCQHCMHNSREIFSKRPLTSRHECQVDVPEEAARQIVPSQWQNMHPQSHSAVVQHGVCAGKSRTLFCLPRSFSYIFPTLWIGEGYV